MHIMKRIFLPLTLLTLFLSASCNNDAEFSNPENSGNVMFNAKFGKATRATDFQFEVKDGISVFASYADSDIAGEYAQNVKYEFTGKQFETNADLKYPESGKDLKFQAIYPYSSAGYSVPEFSFAVKTDQRSHSNYTASDLMTASATGYRNETVDLIFNHRMAKIVINIVADSMPTGEQTLTFRNVKYIADVNLNSNTYFATNATANVTAASNGTNSFKAILPPQSIGKGNIFAEITIGERVFNWELNRDLIFNSGVEYTFTININEEGDIPSTQKEWQPVGKALYTEDLVTALFNYSSVTYEVEVEQNIENPSIIRLVDPYGAAYPHNDPGDYDTSTNHYMVFNCEDPEGIYMDGYHASGMDWGYGEFTFGSLAYYYMTIGNSFEDVKAAGYCGTMDENLCITFPAKTMIISMADYNNGNLYFSNTNGLFKIDLSTTTLAK